MTLGTKNCAAGPDVCGEPATLAVYSGETLASALEQLDRVQLGQPDTATFTCPNHAGWLSSSGRPAVVLPL